MCILGVCRLRSTHTSRSRPSIQQKSSTFGFTCKPNKQSLNMNNGRLGFLSHFFFGFWYYLTFCQHCLPQSLLKSSEISRTSSAKDEQRGAFLKLIELQVKFRAVCENVESEFKCRDLFVFSSEFGAFSGIAGFPCEALRSHPTGLKFRTA